MNQHETEEYVGQDLSGQSAGGTPIDSRNQTVSNAVVVSDSALAAMGMTREQFNQMFA